MDTVPAEGLFAASWLLIALPLAGAAVLLLGGRRTDRWGHLLGCATVVAAFVLGLVLTIDLASAESKSIERRPLHLHLHRVARRQRRAAGRSAVDELRAADHRCGLADPHLLDRLHGARRRPPAVLRLPQPVRRGDAAARPRQQLRGALRRLGGRRSGVLPADRLLVPPPGGGDRRQEGVHHEPGRRRRPGAGDLPDVRPARDDVLRGRLRRRRHAGRRHDHRDRPAAPARRVRQVGPVPAAGVAARRHGGPDAGLGADPRGDHGHRRRLPDRPLRADLRPAPRPRAPSSWRSGRSRCSSARSPAAPTTTSRRCWPTRRSARSATCSWPSGSARSATSPASPTSSRARLLQGRAVPRRRVGHARHGRPGGHAPLRRPLAQAAHHLRHLRPRLPGADRLPVPVGLLHQGRDHRGGARPGRRLGLRPRRGRASSAPA